MSRLKNKALALSLLALGCDASPEGEARSSWVELELTRFQEDGESERVIVPEQLPEQGPLDAVALRVRTDPEACFQLSAAVDGRGHAAVSERSAGPYCRECELRSSTVTGAGVFVLPAATGPLDPASGLSLRFALLDCLTLTPIAAPERPPPLQVEAQAIVAPAAAELELRFIIGPDSILFNNTPRFEELEAALEEELVSAEITPVIVDIREVETLPAEHRVHAGDPSALARALETASLPPKAETTVDVIFGGCLEYDDPFFGPPRALDGYTPRIPGGAGPGDAVFMPGLDCSTADARVLDVSAAAQARVLAHELGHYLGLYHSVEADGSTDQLDDTGADNVMHHNPTRSAAVGFSPSQGRVMRTHPAVRGR